MKLFMAEDNLCAQNLLMIVSHGNAIVAEILRLKNHIPAVYLLETKDLQEKYKEIVQDFSYFKVSDSQEVKISNNSKLQELDDDLKEKHQELISRFYLLFESIYQYVCDLNSFVEQVNEGAFLQQSVDTIMKDVEGKQLLCESLYLYGVMLLLCDRYMCGLSRERLLVAHHRYSSRAHDRLDQVCRLLRDTNYRQKANKRPTDYPMEYFSRVPVASGLVERVVSALRGEDVYLQLALSGGQPAAALAGQASLLLVCLFFQPSCLQHDAKAMREVADKFFPGTWIIPVYMGVTISLLDYWDHCKAAKTALANAINSKAVKEEANKKGAEVVDLTESIHELLKEGMLTDDYVQEDINNIITLIVNSNFVLRWMLLHSSQPSFFDGTKKGRQFRDLMMKESSYDPLKVLELLISTAELELKTREILKRLLESKTETWNRHKANALEAVNTISELFAGGQPLTKVVENEQLKLWFDNIGKQISSLGDTVSTKAMKKITQLAGALEEVEDFHGMRSSPGVVQWLSDSRGALRSALRVAALKEDALVTLETVADLSYAWVLIDTFTEHMQSSIKGEPGVARRLRALFVKLASAMEIPLLRINQAGSPDLVSVSQYYSTELIHYIQKVLQVIPETVFRVVERVIELQTWEIRELPTRLDKDRLREYAQLERRMEVARLTHQASTFTTGILDMRSTLIGVVRVDPARLLEEGLLRELHRHVSAELREHLEASSGGGKGRELGARLQALADSMAGCRRALEYIQDYINIHGLRIWQKQLSELIVSSVAQEMSRRRGVVPREPSAGFMGSLARQLFTLVEARQCTYVSVMSAWYNTRTRAESVGAILFVKLHDALGPAGLHGLDVLYAGMLRHLLITGGDIIAPKNPEYVGLSSVALEAAEPQLARCVRWLEQASEVLVSIGTCQLLRKHIAYQLRTVATFHSATLQACLTTVNEALLSELKNKQKVSPALLEQTQQYLVRCGLSDPYTQLYVPSTSVGLGKVAALILVSQLPRLQLTTTVGELIPRKSGECIDGYPLLIGVYTLLRQTACAADSEREFLDTLCAHATFVAKTKSGEASNGSAASSVVRVLQMWSETFHLEYSQLRDKLPAALRTCIHNTK